MKTSPTQRTLALLRKDGWTAAVVERWNAHAFIRQDLFGYADILAVHPERGTVAVQACAGTDHAKRKAKILAEPRALLCLKAGWQIDLCSWTKKGARGKRKLWEPRVEHLTICSFYPEVTKMLSEINPRVEVVIAQVPESPDSDPPV